MSVQRTSVSVKNEDLEATAELPVLDVAAYEAKVPQDRNTSTDTWIAAPLASAPAAPAAAKDQGYRPQLKNLEDDLRSLSSTLRDVEERLGLKGERLAEIEREFESVRGARAATEQRAVGLARELAETQSALAIAQTRIAELNQSVETRDLAARMHEARNVDLEGRIAERVRALEEAQRQHLELEARIAGFVETLQTQETHRGVFETLLRGLDSEVSDRDGRVAELERQLSALTLRNSELEADLAARTQRIATLEAEVNQLAAALAKSQQDTEVRERANSELRKTVATLTSTASAFGERVRKAEADANARSQEHAAALRAATELQRELEAANASHKHRIDALEAQLASSEAELENRTAALHAVEAEQRERQSKLSAAEARLEEQDLQIADQQETVRRLHDELRESRERMETGEADLRAAEDTLNRVEADLRAKSAKLDELLRTQEEWRSTVEAARHSLDERDTIIRRLENEAANSAALLDNIQLSIKRLDPPPPGTNGAAHGPSEIAPEGATRLLIRSDGDTEVVHVLGRKTTIGRTPDNDLQIDTKFISRHHAVILAAPAHTIIEDLNSTNGIMVNGRRIRRQPLKDGDAVSIGKTQFRFSVRPPAAERRPS